MGVDIGGNAQDVEFAWAEADTLITALTNAATVLDGQSGTRSSAAAAAEQDFSGHFSDVFASNVTVEATDRRDLAAKLRAAAGTLGQLKADARAEQDRRERAREWKREQDSRNGFTAWLHDTFVGPDAPPEAPPAAPNLPVAAPSTGSRQHPTPGV